MSEKVHRSTPLTVEDQGAVRVSSGVMMKKWKVRMMDGTVGLCWTPDKDADGNDFPPPFKPGRNAAFTVVEADGKDTKIRPIDIAEIDRQKLIVRQNCIGNACSLIASGAEGGATLDNVLGLASKLEEWVNA